MSDNFDEEAFRQIARQDTRKFVFSQVFASGVITQTVPVMTDDGEHEQIVRIEGPWMEVGYFDGPLFIKSCSMPASTVANFKVVAE